jgi:hypothetical protein
MSFKRIGLLYLFLFLHLPIWSQIIPDLTKDDHFRPYLSEDEKREQILQSKIPRAKTSQELYPQLYGNVQGLNLPPGIPNPYDAMKITPVGVMKPNVTTISTNIYNSGGSSAEQQRMVADADIAAYEEKKRYEAQLIEEANKELYKPTVIYNLGIHNGEKANRFVKAYSELQDMLEGNQKIDFLKAVWLVESSLDTSLSWEEFNGSFQDGVQVISQLIIQDKLSPNDNLSKIMAIYRYMADTTKIYVKAKEKTVITKPMIYDYDDFAGKKDITKVFVSKLLRTGTGQCMSLPMLYYLYAKAFGAEAYIAFAPQHSYVTFKDKLGNWQNIELTGRMFISTDFHWQSGFITTEQVKSGIYLRPSTEKETIAYLMTTLALTYVKTIGTDDRVLQMATTAKQYFPKSLTAHMIYAGYHRDLWNNVLRQYDVLQLSDDKFNSDEQAKAIKLEAEAAASYVRKDLGWKEIPDWAYKNWLDGVNKLANRDQHIVRRRQLEQQLNRHK